jgi:hypothetical protein
MHEHHVDAFEDRLSSRLTCRRTRRWALGSLVAAVAAGTARAGAEARQGSHQDISIHDLFEMQIASNHLSQLSEMATNVMAEPNQSIRGMERGVK